MRLKSLIATLRSAQGWIDVQAGPADIAAGLAEIETRLERLEVVAKPRPPPEKAHVDG